MIGIDLFPTDRRRVMQDYARLPVLPRPPATFWERAELAFRDTIRTETSVGIEWMRYRRWEQALDALEERTGEALVNPLALRGPTRREALKRAREALRKARADHPDLPDPEGFDEDIRREIGAIRAERAGAGEVSTPGGAVGDLAGTMAAVMVDPVNIASMAWGAPWAAGVLRTALVEAGIAAASETAIQALAAAGGAVVGGGIKALAKAARALKAGSRRLPLQARDAIRLVENQEKTLDEIGELAEGRGIDRRTAHRLHRELLPETLRAVRRGEIPDIERLVRERDELRRAYARVLDQPRGPADDPLVHIRPEDIEASIVARGGFEGLGDVRVKGAGWGLVKFIWRHGEKSPKTPAERVRMEDVLAFPEIIRRFEPHVDRMGRRTWVVEMPDGRRVVYGDRPFVDDQRRRLVTIFVVRQDRLRGFPPSPPRKHEPSGGVPRSRFQGASGDTAAPSSASTDASEAAMRRGDSRGRTGGSPSDPDTAAVSRQDMPAPAGPVKNDPATARHRFAPQAQAARAWAEQAGDVEKLHEQWLEQAQRLLEERDVDIMTENGPVSARELFSELDREEAAMRAGSIACLLGGAAGAA